MSSRRHTTLDCLVEMICELLKTMNLKGFCVFKIDWDSALNQEYPLIKNQVFVAPATGDQPFAENYFD